LLTLTKPNLTYKTVWLIHSAKLDFRTTRAPRSKISSQDQSYASNLIFFMGQFQDRLKLKSSSSRIKMSYRGTLVFLHLKSASA